jgi:hypothetical protein
VGNVSLPLTYFLVIRNSLLLVTFLLLGVTDQWRAVVHKLYKQVKARIRTQEVLSESFSTNVGVKQGCPLSPTLFMLYIDKLEEWINEDGQMR